MSGLSFLNTGFLAALGAIAIPILIHLISRRRAIRWKFAAMEFLLRSHRRVARRLRIKQLLLLLLRCLMIASLALIFAKPFLQRAQGSSPMTPRAIVLIVDDSFSMRYQGDDGRTLFEQARRSASRFLKSLRGEDQVALLHGATARRPLPHEQTELTFDKQVLIRLLQKWKPTYRATDLPAAMQRAGSILQKRKGYQPQILVFSDLARHSINNSKVGTTGLPPVEFVPIRTKKPAVNWSITQVVTQPAPFASLDAYRFTVTLRNFSKKAQTNLALTLHLNGRARTRGTVSLPPLGTVEKTFVIQLPRAGLYRGYAEVDKDALPGDNRYYFTLRARQRPKVLLINGDPKTTPYLDELYYLDRALRDAQTPFVVQSKLASANLPDPQQFQVIYLCNVPQVPDLWRAKLNKFVRKGGGLFVSMGDQITPDYYNLQLGDLMPRRLRRTALAAQRPDGTGIAIQRYFGDIQGAHPIFRSLYRSGIIFQTARITKLMLVQTRKTNEAGQILWKYSHGPPALIERRVGKGRVLLLTTTIDRDWTDLPIRPFFQPWLAQVTSYLAGGARFQQGKSLLIGQSATFTLKRSEPVEVKPPKGTSYILRASGSTTFRFRGGTLPGFYQFSREGRALPILPKAVNIDPAESDTTALSEKSLQRMGSVVVRSRGGQFLKQSARMWPFLIFGLCLFFLAEGLVLRFL